MDLLSMSENETPRSLKRNLLNARDRLGSTIIEIVAADVAEHGPEVVAARVLEVTEILDSEYRAVVVFHEDPEGMNGELAHVDPRVVSAISA
jgi:hypothetical protein